MSDFSILYEVEPRLKNIPEEQTTLLWMNFMNSREQADLMKFLSRPLSVEERIVIQSRFKDWLPNHIQFKDQ